MKIEKVEAFLMSFPMPEEVRLPFWGDSGQLSREMPCLSG